MADDLFWNEKNGDSDLTGPSIEALNLSKRYGQFLALSDFNLKLEGAKCVGFLGPNGAGKTTTLKIFTDLIKASSGKALINGVNVHTDKKKALASVSALIETPEIYPALTPREGLSMIAEIRGVPQSERKRRIEDAVREVHMEEWIDKRVGKFSKGMKQRVCIASTLLSDPALLLLDEPTNGLDPRGMSEVRDIIKSLKGKDRLIFMSSHILSEVAEVCDEVAMIDHGKLVIYDTIANVTAHVSGGESIVEVSFKKPIQGDLISRITKIEAVTSVEKMEESKIQIRFKDGVDVQESILVELVRMNIGVISYRPAASALEDVYLNLIKETV